MPIVRNRSKQEKPQELRVEMDIKTKEVMLICTYCVANGHGFDAIVEHRLSIDQAKRLRDVVHGMIITLDQTLCGHA